MVPITICVRGVSLLFVETSSYRIQNSMEIVELTRLVLLIWCLFRQLMAASLFNFPACGDCSSRADVPCRIERIDDHCYHTEFRDKWPGQPTELMSREIEVENGRRSASFTWRPPYDASVESLSGFFLTVNILLAHGMGSLGPFCFHANLNGTDWSTIPDPHAVLFNFDCVTTTSNKEIHVSLHVSSSPMPNKKPGYAEARAIIGRNAPPEIEELKINYTVTGTDVAVKFGPLVKNVKYHLVCLSPCSSHHEVCLHPRKISEFGVGNTLFTNVKPDNYSIMIRRNIEITYYATKCFSVVEPPPKVGNSPLILSIIILGCLLFVVIATTMMFFFLRKYQRFIPGCIETCKRNGQYEPTLQNIPNNTTDSPEDAPQELWFLFSTENKSFTNVAKTLANIVNKQTRFRVDIHATICENNRDILIKSRKFSNQRVALILSEDTKRQLQSIQNNLPQPDETSSVQEEFLSKVFTTIFSEERQGPCLISVCSLTFISKAFETYHLVNMDKGNLSIDTNELKNFLNTLNPVDSCHNEDLADNQDVKDFIQAVTAYTEERRSSNLSDHGYGSGSYNNHHPSTQHSTLISYPQELTCHLSSLHPKNKREEDTKQWVKSQTTNMTSLAPLQTVMHHGPVPYVQRIYQPKPCHREDLLNQQLRTFYPPVEYEKYDHSQKLCVPQTRNNRQSDIDWEGPDSDSESVTMSTILQQGVELNRNYMRDVNC